MRFRLGVVAAMMVLSCCSSSGSGEPFVKITGRLPEVRGTTLDGTEFGPNDYAGRVLVLNFWNQDCPPCLEEAPVLQQDFLALASNGVVFLGVVFVGGGWPDDPGAARAFHQRQGIAYPSIVDSSSKLAEGLSIVGIPTTVVVDRSGALRFERLGQVRPGDLERIVEEIDG